MLAYYFGRKRYVSATLKYSDVRIVKRAARSNRQRYRFILPVLRVLAIALLFVAFARPRAGTEVTDVTSEGIDIVMLLDVSSSMLAEDFKPNNRLYVAKEELKKFVNKRTNDRIGLVVFARYAYTQCPLTLDYGVLLNFVDQVDIGVVDDGTAIGMAIATAANRLRESNAKSKVMVLLTDGDNNAGEIDPLTAANIAAAYDIKIYTIAAGRPGNAMYPVQDPIFGKRYIYQPTNVNEESLRQIAERTGGKYFRARSGEELDQIYSTIDKLEKTEIKVAAHVQYRELFQYFVYAALALLALEILLANTWFRKLP
ncbi:aerotolerance regulator BatA [candidate division GN15 bacterium]|uniref:Aerotolerance regulator BatA n=1 Tax=candidate division GN15 bacterium TaxID=2072418 RepID=A0A855X5T3_9BACT|nr:MAG: aerotolerance regulator BatA [candidate division GN15 bacterium]